MSEFEIETTNVIFVTHEVNRCAICNNVSSSEIATFPGQYRKGLTFSEDAHKPFFMICSVCDTPEKDDELIDSEFDDEDLSLLSTPRFEV